MEVSLRQKKPDIGYCGLALGVTGAFNSIKYLGVKNYFTEIVILGMSLFILSYYAFTAVKNKKKFIITMKDFQNKSLFPTFLMTSANIFTFMNLKAIWLLVLGGHFLYSLFFYQKVFFKSTPLVSYYIPIVGIAVNIPHAHHFHMDLLGKALLYYGITGYLLVSWRLIIYWRSFQW